MVLIDKNPLYKYMFELQAIATLDQDPPVQNTWYTILDTTKNVRVISIACRQIHTEAGAITTECRIIIDGRTLTASQAMNDSTWYYNYMKLNAEGMNMSTTSQPICAVPIEGHSVKIEMRITDAPGTAQQLDGSVIYEVLEVTT